MAAPSRARAPRPVASRRRMLRRAGRATVPAAALAAALGLGSCGSAEDAAPIDASALQRQLAGVADAIDRCVAKTNDARKCDQATELGALPTGTQLGSGAGQVAISAPAALHYDLTGKVNATVHFDLLAQPVGARRRMCAPPGDGACPKNGAW